MTRTLIKCGWLITMDDRLGDGMRNAEILVEDDRIAAIGHNLGAQADETIDASDMIVMPGLVNAHLHTWQAGLRGIGSEWIYNDYFKYVYANMATLYGPEDNYLGNLIGALNQIDSGVTTLFDYCHNITSLEQAERSIDALEETGIRALFGLGAGKLRPEQEALTPFEQRSHPVDRIEHLRKGRLASDDRLVTMALAAAGPHWASLEVSLANFRLAREYGLVSSSHATKRPADAVAPDGYWRLAEAGLLGPWHSIVHGNYLGDDELKMMVDHGVAVIATVQTEFRGYGADPLVARTRALGGLPALGADVEPKVSGEMFREMQAALINVLSIAVRENKKAGLPPLEVAPVRTREVLAWATLGGARAMGLEDRIGSLTPGKQADIIMLRADDLNLFPVHDPVYSVVEMANGGNVDTVMIAGRIAKRAGRLTYPRPLLQQKMALMRESVDRVMTEGKYPRHAA